jgi:hypothetical protein
MTPNIFKASRRCLSWIIVVFLRASVEFGAAGDADSSTAVADLSVGGLIGVASGAIRVECQP